MPTQFCLIPRDLRELQKTFGCELFDRCHTIFCNYHNGEFDQIEAYDAYDNLIDCHDLEYKLGPEKFDALIERFALCGRPIPTRYAAE